MRKSLVYALLGTVAACGWSMSSGRNAPEIVTATRHVMDKATQATLPIETPAIVTVASQPVGVLPSTWTAAVPGEATRDLFAAVLPPTPVPTPPPKVVATPTPKPVPQTPALTYQLVGKMIGPNGLPALYLQHGDVIVEAQPGAPLEDGYTVESVSGNSVTLAYAPSGFHITLDLPEIAQ